MAICLAVFVSLFPVLGWLLGSLRHLIIRLHPRMKIQIMHSLSDSARCHGDGDAGDNTWLIDSLVAAGRLNLKVLMF